MVLYLYACSMRPSDLPPDQSSDAALEADRREFEDSLAQVTDSLRSLTNRYQQIKMDQASQADLKQRLALLQADVTAIQSQLAEVEARLESRLFNWKSQQEVFWQILRFSGLGLVLGYFLRACTS